MRLKKQLTRLLVVGGLAVMTTGVSQAGSCGEDKCCWCFPHPKAVSQPVAAEPSLFSTFLTVLLELI